jgi:vancomycin resistance protein YoaR
VSQLATTTFNAVFFGGYEDVTHKPHSLYFSRYPMGREATVNYPNLDLKFRNNTDAGVLIRAYYSDTSITVTFYGDNGGKQVSAEGPNILAERPPEREYTDDPTLPRGEEERVESGYTGYDVEVYRIIEQPGHDTVRERFFWRYKMVPEQWVRGTMKPTTTTSSTTPGASPSSTTGPSTTTT